MVVALPKQSSLDRGATESRFPTSQSNPKGISSALNSPTVVHYGSGVKG